MYIRDGLFLLTNLDRKNSVDDFGGLPHPTVVLQSQDIWKRDVNECIFQKK